MLFIAISYTFLWANTFLNTYKALIHNLFSPFFIIALMEFILKVYIAIYNNCRKLGRSGAVVVKVYLTSFSN